jgi:hypothetical protein
MLSLKWSERYGLDGEAEQTRRKMMSKKQNVRDIDT